LTTKCGYNQPGKDNKLPFLHFFPGRDTLIFGTSSGRLSGLPDEKEKAENPE
jgi:hypothetical protein